VGAGVGEAEEGSQAYALDAYLQADTQTSKMEVKLQNLHDVWDLAHEPGAERDIKLYMLYMEGLGRLGDLASLQRIWNSLTKDDLCRKIWEREGDIDSTSLSHRCGCLLC
jgi:hypothetical protein